MNGEGTTTSIRLRLLLNDPVVAKRLFVAGPKKSEGNSEECRLSGVPGLQPPYLPPSLHHWPNVAQSWQMQIKLHHHRLPSATF